MATFTWTSIPVIGTSRLVLRPLTVDDVADLLAIYGDPAVMEFASDPPFADSTLVYQTLASMQRLFVERRSIEWGITESADGRIIGTCGIHSFEPPLARAEIGCLLARARWGRGIMREALGVVIALGFDQFDLASLRADIDAPNARSLALFRRLGFQSENHEGTLLALTRERWQDRSGMG